MRKLLLFVAGMVVGALLSRTPVAEAASNLMFGSYMNAAKAVIVTSTGQVEITTN